MGASGSETGPLRDRLARLAKLLREVSIGDVRLTPLPGGGVVTGSAADDIEASTGSHRRRSLRPEARTVVYGNGLFAMGRYTEAADVYSRLLEV